jgi:excinuclease ABC subunit A
MNADEKKIIVRNCTEHNLKAVDVDIPHHQLTVVTGVSGSGKSSLVFDTICKEGQRRYLESFSAYARQFLGKLGRPSVGHIEGLSPAIAVDQKTVVRSPRSTVGTMTELYDYLRLLFARLGAPAAGYETVKLERRLFSFNSPFGACPLCKGLGLQDRVDTQLLIADPSKTLREGALVITTPSGYIIYSQVTMEVLNRVCEAHGFNVDIPWQDLTDEQRKIVLYGSDRIKIPYGKHPLESRLKWSGITAKPREEGYYKGIIPVIENILRVSRNKNILRFARSMPCETCNGTRLKPEALAVVFRDRNIAQLAEMTIDQLHDFFTDITFSKSETAAGESIREVFLQRTSLLRKLGLGYLTLDRESTTLSGGEAQRIRLTTQVGTGLRGILYVLDEPSIGLHHRDNERLLEMLRLLRDNGNTVLVVEHDEDTIRSADRLIDIGPGAGVHGGEILFNGPLQSLLKEEGKGTEKSRTRAFLTGTESIPVPSRRRTGNGNVLRVVGAEEHNLKNIDVPFRLGVLNVVTGVSGAGKSTLVHDILANFLKNRLHRAGTSPGKHREIAGVEFIDKVIEIDQAPIGRTPRSNPATYTKLFDHVRDLFASLPQAGERKWDKGRFSFNVKGGRCESCEGAGLQQIGMHFLGNVDVVCDECGGKRFNDETLEIRYKGNNIYDILEMPIDEAVEFFSQHTKISRFLAALQDLGLGYIALGQSSTTLSGGEAQRIKLAAELCKPATGKTLYILDEPTTGLHAADIKILLESLNRLVDKGNTVITVEHHPDFIKTADWVVDLGPESGERGGRLVAAGTPEQVAQSNESFTGAFLRETNKSEIRISKYETNSNDQNTKSKTGTDDAMRHVKSSQKDVSGFGFRASDLKLKKPTVLPPEAPILLEGVSTHNLKNIDVAIPVNTLTVITGVSGSGKSSLAFDTIFAEGRRRFLSTFSTYARRMLADRSKADMTGCSGLMPTIAVSQKTAAHNPRSTVGTMTEIYDYYRLLFARVGKHNFTGKTLLASMFSFNHHQGACTFCKGLGIVTVCDPVKLVTHPDRSLLAGALDGSKTGTFYGDPYGQHTAILQAVGEDRGIDFSRPWRELDEEARRTAMYGTGDKTYDVTWKFKRKNRVGEHRFDTDWKGFVNYVNEEYERKHADKRGLAMLPLMTDQTCPQCEGRRLKPEFLSVYFAGLNIAQLCQKAVDQSLDFFKGVENGRACSETDAPSERDLRVTEDLRQEVVRRLEFLQDVGLGYVTLDRNSATLSGGEAQRIRLAGQLGSRLTGVTYVLDEPTIGLHSRDTRRLLRVLKNLRDTGNTVIVVEHDAEIIRAADHIIDLGPAGGREGGRIIAQGTVEKVKENNRSKTGKYLKNPDAIAVPRPRRPLTEGLRITGAKANNLKDVDVHVPSEGIIVLTGVSGSGKSTLLFDVIATSAKRGGPVGCRSITRLHNQIVTVDQEGIGAGRSSNPATYTGLFDKIRGFFAAVETARNRGYKKSRFSFNVKGGRCETCGGMGEIRTSMDFLADVWTTCEDCKGRRYNEETLQCTFQSKNIAEVLEMTIDEALEFFSDYPAVRSVLEQMEAVGLGYLRLGQPGNTLSGGEVQRLKLVTELIKGKSKNVLYLFDEPTTGLHFEDVRRLLGLFHRLVDAGHTLLVIEHHPDIIKNADYVIDLGPEGGDRGGRIVAQGTPEKVAEVKDSYTGKILKLLF